MTVINWTPASFRNICAALGSFLIPGIGQFWQGRIVRASCVFIGTICLWLVGMGWILHLWACYDAAVYHGITEPRIIPTPVPPHIPEPVQETEPPHFEQAEEFVPLSTESPEVIHGRLLGLKGKVALSDVRRAYRKRIAQYHPDKVAHLGDAFRFMAEEETKRLNEAWDFFKQKYGNF